MRSGLLFALGTAFLWGITPFFLRHALETFDPISVATARLLGGGFLFWVIRRGMGLQPAKVTGGKARWWLVLGATGLALNHILFAVGLQYTSVSAAIIIVQVQTITVSILGWLILGERISPLKAFGMVAVIAGIALVGWREETGADLFSSKVFWGNAAVFLSGVSWGFYGISQTMLSRSGNSFATLERNFLLAGGLGIPFAIGGFELTGPVTFGAVATLGALAFVCTVGSYLFLAQAMQRLPVATAVILVNLSPLFALSGSYFLFKEPIGELTLLGAFLALGGCLVVVGSDHFGKRRGRAEPVEVEVASTLGNQVADELEFHQ